MGDISLLITIAGPAIGDSLLMTVAESAMRDRGLLMTVVGLAMYRYGHINELSCGVVSEGGMDTDMSIS